MLNQPALVAISNLVLLKSPLDNFRNFEEGSPLGTTLLLDGVLCKAAILCASKVGRAAVEQIATSVNSGMAQERMLEIAGAGKIALEEGSEIAVAAIENVASNPELVGQSGKNVVRIMREPVESTVARPNVISGRVPVDTTIFSNLKLIGDNIWQLPGGLIYGFDQKFGNRLHHILDHINPNSAKKNHTVFNVTKNEIIELLDEAWKIKNNPLASDPRVYVVDMKRPVGVDGELAIRIVVEKPGTAAITTAYPVKL